MVERTDDYMRGDESLLGDADRTLGADRNAVTDADRSVGAVTDADADPAVIRADIRETRERVGDTLEQIGERLNPRNIKEQVKDNVRDATIGRVENMARSAADRVSETRYTVMDTIRENPVPAALAGIGLGWLFVNARRKGSSGEVRFGASSAGRRYGYAGRPYGNEYESGSADERSAFVESSRSGAGWSGGTMADSSSGISDAASGLTDKAQNAAGAVADRAQSAASAVADRAQGVASTVASQTRRQTRRVEDTFYDSPLAVGAATLALGLATGLALPKTEKEVELMGDARDRLVDRARDVAQEAKDKVEQVADRAMTEAKSGAEGGARSEGLTG